MQVLIFCESRLKRLFTPPKLFLGGGKIGEGWCHVETQRTRSYFWELLPLGQFWRKSIVRKAFRRFRPFDAENWLLWQRPLSDRETNTRLNIYSHMSTSLEHLVNIDLVGSEISLLEAIVKKRGKESNSSRT